MEFLFFLGQTERRSTEFNHHHKSINFKVSQEPELSLKPDTTETPLPPHHIHIDVYFLHLSTHCYYNRPHHDHLRRHPQLIATDHSPSTWDSICITASDFKDSSSSSSSSPAYRSLTHVLTNIGVDPRSHARVAGAVVCMGRVIADLASKAGRRVVPVLVEVKTVHVHTRDEREWVERGLNESASEAERRGDGGMVAAKAEAVRGLKRKRVAKEIIGESCRVCFEEFVEGEEVTCMPCRHVFHEGCIETWLGTSHCCPICRFKMPTDHD